MAGKRGSSRFPRYLSSTAVGSFAGAMSIQTIASAWNSIRSLKPCPTWIPIDIDRTGKCDFAIRFNLILAVHTIGAQTDALYRQCHADLRRSPVRLGRPGIVTPIDNSFRLIQARR